MKNIHVLPTDKPSRLHLGNSGLVLCDLNFGKNTINGQHIYITSDEEIKDRNWVYNIVSKTKFKASKQLIGLINNPNVTLTTNKKIILTTDPDLIKDDVQAIDDEFLEWFVKNPSCEFVEVQKWASLAECGYSYHITIPQEEPKPIHQQIIDLAGGEERCKELLGIKPKQEIDMSKYISGIDPYDTQETLEEAAETLYPINNTGGMFMPNKEEVKNIYRQEGFIAGVKSDAARDYWFEQVKKK
jgi:hypothetical protein